MPSNPPPPVKAPPTKTEASGASLPSIEAGAAATGSEARIGGWRRVIFLHHELGAWFTSAIIHATIIVVMALLIERVVERGQPVDVAITANGHSDLQGDLPSDSLTAGNPGPGTGSGLPSMNDDPLGAALGEAPLGIPDFSGTLTGARDPDSSEPLATNLPTGRNGALWGRPNAKGGGGGGGLGGREPGRRGQLAAAGGGSAGSEAAVERGLKWLLAHQHEDGGWRFSLQGPPCDNLCRNGGIERSTTGATALALLPFYGAGYTHKDGPYAEQVNRGLYYLGRHMLVTPNGGDLQEGTMYAQGLSAIVLCEAYAMSKDPNLRNYAQQAVKFILYAQDRISGGWRYFPGQAGDTTVTGWQLMSLKSAQLAGLDVPTNAFFLADKFLDSVQADKGAAYGYLRPGEGATTSAVGLLCRMYLGWGPKNRSLLTGVNNLDKLGPSSTDMYYNYYATQVMYHHGSQQWDRWNKKLREYLITTQAKEGHEAGSWYFIDRHGDKGGRLYNTALAILTLEVYYRYLPLYSNKAVEGGF